MTSVATSHFRLRLLGPPQLTDDSGRIPTALGPGKPLALLCYLAVRGEARRDEVVDLLWRNIGESKARNAFRQALHRLRTALGDDLVPHDRDKLRLAPGDRLAVDMRQFEQDVRAGRLESALALWQGDFLEGFELAEPGFDHWAEQERIRVRSQLRQVLRDFVADASNAGRWPDAIAHAQRLLTLTPFEPEAAKLAATTLVAAGRRGDALQLLNQFVERTQAQLGIGPHPDVQALLTRLTRDAQTTPSQGRPRIGASPADALPFVGREAELSRLLAVWQGVHEDAGALVLIEGDPGLGKTRLAHELISHARALAPARVLSGRERAGAAQLPFAVFVEALRPLVRAPGVAGASAHLLAEAARLLPEMRDVLDLPHVSAIEDETSRLRFFEGVAALIDAAAYEQHILIVLEDLQHVAPSSLDLLSYLVARLAGAPVMWVLTVRPAEATPSLLSRLRSLAGAADPLNDRARTIALAPIPREAVATALADPKLGLNLAPDRVDRIARQVAGNPYRLVLAARAAVTGTEVPAAPLSLRDLLADSIRMLSSTQRRVLVVLALLRRPVSVAALGEAAHVPQASARECVRALTVHGLVDSPSEDAVIANSLAADIALDAAGASGRAFLAGWILEALEQRTDVDAAEMARLAAFAGRAPQAFAYARRAAYAAVAAGAHAEATQLLAMARTFASSPAEVREIEGALDSVGSGRRRLARGAAVATRGDETASAADAGATTMPRTEGDVARAVPVTEPLFPHWRVLFGAAVGTLVAAALVLAIRTEVDSRALSVRDDTLLISDDLSEGSRLRRLAVGNLEQGFRLQQRFDKGAASPAWLDSLSRDWVRPVVSPNGARVAVARMTRRGADLLLLGRERSDSNALLRDERAVTPFAWSPDGAWLLVGRGAASASPNVMGLYALRVGTRQEIAVDTSAAHIVTEALWSPDGTHLAWVARIGGERQQDVFVSLADGSHVRNVSRDPAEDYHIAWSPTGELLAFTSMRDGNAELYAADLEQDRLWRLTQHPSHDDLARFSPDGRHIAFESTRGGLSGVYVMRALGGKAVRIGSVTPAELLGWRGARTPYVDYIRIAARNVAVGDSALLAIQAFDERGDSIPATNVEWHVLDTAVARLSASEGPSGRSAPMLVGLHAGLARIVAIAARWRTDTAFVRVGSAAASLLEEDFDGGLARWRALGRPPPAAGNAGLILRAGREWDSGVLLRDAVPLEPGLAVRAAIEAPWQDARDELIETSVALVAPEDESSIDATTPQFLRITSITWKAETGRLIFAVGKEVFTEPARLASGAHGLSIEIQRDSTVRFSVDGVQRWQSTLRIAAPRSGRRAQLWISGRATGDQVRLRRVSLSLAGR